jgi:L-ascorbate metabolism protein UlaG (beta-lactamase superfamily)
MEITHFGAGCLYLATKKTSILVDPDIEQYGLNRPKLKADILLYTSLNDERSYEQDVVTIDWPGEYEVNNISIEGIAAQAHIDKPDQPFSTVIYSITIESKKILIIGNIAPELTEDQFEAIGDVQVLVLPVGGHGLTLNGADASNMASRLEPQIIIPVHYDDGATKYPMPQEKVDVFLGEIGIDQPEKMDKLKLNTKDDLNEDTKLVILNIQI